MGRFLLTTHLTSSFTTATTTTNDTTDLPCTDFCDPSCGDFDACYAFPAIPDDTLPPPPLPLPPPPPTTTVATPSSYSFKDLFNLSPIAIVIIIVLASAILLISYYAVVIKYCSLLTRLITRRDLARMQPNQSSDPNNPHTTAANNQFVDHPIWLISTVGLNQSIINRITILRYKKEDGLIDCTDCSVCLSEFQQGETLRLLPKCKHAFHIECIDTWLRSHTTCPMCRASIVPNPNEPTFGHSRRGELTQVVDSDSSDLELGNTQHGTSSSNHNNNNNNNGNDNVTLLVGEDRGTQTGDYEAARNILAILFRRSYSMDYQNSGVEPNVSSSNSSASSSSRPPHPRVSLKRSYSWSERVFCQNDRNSVMSP